MITKPFILCAGRGATSYELQVGNYVFRFVHLMGGHWTRWTFRDRFSLKYYPPEGED